MCSNSQLKDIINGIVRAYRETYGTDIRAILLYGSYARGDYNNQSDIDFAAIVDGDRMELQNKLPKVWDKAAGLGVENDAVISPVVIPFDEYGKNKLSLPYYRNIDKDVVNVG